MPLVKIMRYLTIILMLLVLSGCASITNREREFIYDDIEECNSISRSVYFSATKDDLVFTLAPLAMMTGVQCQNYTVSDCGSRATAWALLAPFTVGDIPFAFVRDLYEIPSDIKFSKKMKACQASDVKNDSSKD